MAQLIIDVDVKGANQVTTLDKNLNKVEKTSKKVNNSVSKINKDVAVMTLGIGTLISATRGMIKASDAWTSMESQLKLVTSSASELLDVQLSLSKVANDSRHSLEATTTLYARLSRATEHLNVTEAERLRATETINKALIISGATTQEATSTITQLSQAMASGVLRGEEFNSVSENGSEIMNILSRSLGKTIGELREMAHAGELTTKVLLDGLASGAETTDEKFAKMDTTVGQAFTNINSAVTTYIGRANTAVGATGWFSSGVEALTDGINDLSMEFIDYAKLSAQWTIENDAFIKSMREGTLVTEERVDTSDALRDILVELVNEENAHIRAVATNAWKVQELADQEDQLAKEKMAVNATTQKETIAIEDNTQAKQQETVATVQLAQAEATGTFSSSSWLYDSDGNLKDTSASRSSEYSVYSAANINPFMSAVVNNTNYMNDYSATVQSVDNSMRDLERSLSSISAGLGIDYYSKAQGKLFPSGTSGGLSFAQATGSVQSAWDLFQTDTFNEEFLNAYNDRMDELIGTLEEFEQSANYNSKAEQTFAKHEALRQVSEFQDGQVEVKEEVDAQLAVLQSIDDKTKANANTSRTQYTQTSSAPRYAWENVITGYNIYGNPIYEDKYEYQGEYPVFGNRTGAGRDIGYKSGGYTGNMGVNEEAGIVHGQEYVVNAQTTADLGLNGSGGVFQSMREELASLSQLMYEQVKTSKRTLAVEIDVRNIALEAS